MVIDEQKIDQTILALLYLTLHDGCRAWKSFDWQAMHRLHERGLIEDPVNQAKSVVLTGKGLTDAERLFKTVFDKKFRPDLATEAKSIVALAFRNGPIEDVHAGKKCPVCAGKPEYAHITQDEMKSIMKKAVDTVYSLLWLRQNDPERYAEKIEYGDRCTRLWDDPAF